MILLDTHVWIYWVARRWDALPSGWGQHIADSSDSVGVASISCLEVALLVRKNRVALDLDLVDWFKMALARSSIECFPLTPEIAVRSTLLPELHKDPMDRIIIATAIEHDAVLLTKDETIRKYPEVRLRHDECLGLLTGRISRAA